MAGLVAWVLDVCLFVDGRLACPCSLGRTHKRTAGGHIYLPILIFLNAIFILILSNVRVFKLAMSLYADHVCEAYLVYSMTALALVYLSHVFDAGCTDP